MNPEHLLEAQLLHDPWTAAAAFGALLLISALLSGTDTALFSLQDRERRDLLATVLRETGFGVHLPRGAYYIMTDISGLTRKDDVSFAMELVARGGVACVPGSSFFLDPADGRAIVRFCFAKKRETLERAALVLRERLGAR